MLLCWNIYGEYNFLFLKKKVALECVREFLASTDQPRFPIHWRQLHEIIHIEKITFCQVNRITALLGG
jgi:hypothetical protein